MSAIRSADRYGVITQWLHWTIAVLVIALVAMGKLGEIEADQAASALFFWHSSVGVLVFALTLVRIIVRISGAHPPPPAKMSGVSRALSRTMHGALYVLLFAMPLSGWLAASSEGAAAPVFGITSIPVLTQPIASSGPKAVAAGKEAENAFEEVHEVLGNILLVLASLHIVAALKHHFIDRDEVLRRMIPVRQTSRTAGKPHAS